MRDRMSCCILCFYKLLLLPNCFEHTWISDVFLGVFPMELGILWWQSFALDHLNLNQFCVDL